MGIVSHPQFLVGLMQNLDSIDEITQKELYQRRSIPDRRHTFDRPWYSRILILIIRH
jgi:hypothetical protein